MAKLQDKVHHMEDTLERLFAERLGRYQAAIALEPTDRVPIATGSNYFSEVYSGNTMQETLYDPEKWLKGEMKFIEDYPEVDVLRSNRIWGPSFDAVGLNTYKLPGRELAPTDQFQFVEKEYMLADEYDALIADPVKYMFETWLPRVLGDYEDPTSVRSQIALVKGGITHAMYGQIMRNRSMRLQADAGMPQPMTGFFLAPFDVLADAMRGLTGALMDCFRQPDKVTAACDRLVEEMANLALNTADPLKRYPIFVPTHKPMFMSPDQFDQFYWPSFKRTIDIILDAGYKVRAYLEGDWSHHWHHLRELPKGSVLCDIDTQADIQKAKADLGGYQCIAGGVQDSALILGKPDEVYQHVKELCETVGRGGGWIVSGGCNIPHTTKPENFRALIDAVMDHGVYDKNLKPAPRNVDPSPTKVEAFRFPKVFTPWEQRKSEIGPIMGEEDLIRRPWESVEASAYTWLWQWVL